MVTSVVEKTNHRANLSSDQIGGLARTYDHASEPIWVHDLRARCLYCNPPAMEADPAAPTSVVFDIVDHQGRTVGRLLTHAS